MINKQKLGWIVHNELITQDIIPNSVPELLRKKGHEVVIADIARFSDKLSTTLPSDVDLWSGLGTISFLKRLPQLTTLRNIPLHSFFMSEGHSYMRYQSQIPKDKILNKDGFILPLSECMNRSASSISNALSCNSIHIRPDNGLKVAEAHQMNLNDDEWMSWIKNTMQFSGANENTLFWFFPKQKIDAEYRLVIFNRKVVSQTPYPHDFNKLDSMDSSVPKAAIDLGNEVAQKLNLSDPIYVMDIARQGKTYKVIEINCMASSGWYKLSPEAVVNHLSMALTYIANDLY